MLLSCLKLAYPRDLLYYYWEFLPNLPLYLYRWIITQRSLYIFIFISLFILWTLPLPLPRTPPTISWTYAILGIYFTKILTDHLYARDTIMSQIDCGSNIFININKIKIVCFNIDFLRLKAIIFRDFILQLYSYTYYQKQKHAREINMRNF